MQVLTGDAQVIDKSRSEPEVFTEVFDRHFDVIHRYLHRRVGRDLADDIASQTFTEAFAQRGRYDTGQESARPWLFGIATNLLRRHHRKEVRRLRAYAKTGVDEAAELDIDSIAARLHADEAGPTLAKALSTLRSNERDVLCLYALAELTYQEIGKALDLSVGTVRSRLSRARKRSEKVLHADHRLEGHLIRIATSEGVDDGSV